MNFVEIDFSEYKKIRLELLKSVEGFKGESYKDTNNYATIGIGINIAADKKDKIWLKIVLYYLFDLLKDENEIDFAQFDSYQYTFKNIIKDTKSYKYKQYKILIDKIAKNTKSLKTADLNQSIETEIKAYIKETTKDNRATRLSESDLKITKNAKGESQYIKFKLNLKEAEKLFNIMVINYEVITLKTLNNKGITDFNKIKEKDENHRKYYKEFIPFVSATYQDSRFITQNKLLSQAAQFQSRFLMWAIIRYDFILDKHKKDNKWDIYSRRRIKQSAIFNFNNKKDKEIETDDEKFNTCISIFKTLNLLNISHKKQTYLEYFEGIDEKMQKAIKDDKDVCYKKGKPYNGGGSCKLYHSGFINPSELKPLKDILNPYAQYLDSLIPQAHFQNSADFTRFALESTQSTTKSANKDFTQAKQYRFKLHNIYFIDNTNYNEVRAALQSRANQTDTNPKNSTPKQNILIIITDKLKEQIRITKPKDCYLYVVCAKGNEIDCSFCNDVLLDSTPQNDECELYCYELETNKPKLTLLHSNDEIELTKDSKEDFSEKQDIFEYNIDKNNCLCIMQDEETIIRLANYRFYMEQDNNE